MLIQSQDILLNYHNDAYNMAIFYGKKEKKDKIVIKVKNRLVRILSILGILGILVGAALFAYSTVHGSLFLYLALIVGIPSLTILIIMGVDMLPINLEIGNAMKKGKVIFKGTPYSISDYEVEIPKK
jgi:hypothetical protein